MSDTIPQETPQDNILPPETTFIYTLSDPSKPEEIRYVGKTNEPQRRFEEHLYENPNTYKGRWVAKLRSNGTTPIMQIIEEVPFDLWIERELYWIDHYLQLGHPLTNTYFGSAGVGMVPPEVRAKMSASRTGRKMPPEVCAKIALAKTGTKASPEVRAKLSASHKGKPTAMKGRRQTPEAKAKMSIAKRKKRAPMPEEQKRKISEAQIGKKVSDETRARLSTSHKGKSSSMKGKKFSPEVRANMSLGKRRAKAMRNNPPGMPTLWD